MICQSVPHAAPATRRKRAEPFGSCSPLSCNRDLGHLNMLPSPRCCPETYVNTCLPDAPRTPNCLWTIATLIPILRYFVTVLYDLDYPTIKFS